MSSTEYLPYSAIRDLIISTINPQDSSLLSNSEIKTNLMLQEENIAESFLPTNRDPKKIKINESNEAKLISNIKK
jgi:hypothetical protein